MCVYNFFNRWNTFRTLCDNSKRIGICLEITADLPSADIIERWLGEPIKCASINTSIFLSNRQGFPVLSRAHQALIKHLYKVSSYSLVTYTYFQYVYTFSGAHRSNGNICMERTRIRNKK